MNKAFTIQQYMDADCMQFEGPARMIGILLHRETNGVICNGCPKDGSCASQRQLCGVISAQKPIVKGGETVREEAARLGISIGEVRRRRNGETN